MKYRAFISYSHRDKVWGEWLHKSLEAYKVPKPIVGTTTRSGESVPARIFPVFRDREELPTSTCLKSAIQEALEQSCSLIVICSPRSAKSLWVNQEILNFKRLGRENRIFAIVVDGTPNGTDHGAPDDECFPPALRFKLGPDGELSSERTETIAADARPHADGKSNSLLKLLAGILNVNYDDLKRRDEIATRRRQRNLLTIAAALTLTFATLSLITLQQRRLAIAQRDRAEVQLYQTSIALADSSLRDIRPDFAQNALWDAPSRLRGWEWGYLLQRAYPSFWSQRFAAASQIDRVAVADNGRTWAAWTWNHPQGYAAFWKDDSGFFVQEFTFDAPIQSATVSPDGSWVVFVFKKELVTCDGSGKIQNRIPVPAEATWSSASFLQSGSNQLTAFTHDGWHQFDAESGMKLRQGESSFTPEGIAYSPHNGRVSIYSSLDGDWQGDPDSPVFFAAPSSAPPPEEGTPPSENEPSDAPPHLWLDTVAFAHQSDTELRVFRSGGVVLTNPAPKAPRTEQLMESVDVSFRHTRQTGGEFSADDKHIWFFTLGNLYHWNTTQENPVAEPVTLEGNPTCFKIVGDIVAIGTDTGEFYFHDVISGTKLESYAGHTGKVLAVAKFDSHFWLSLGEDGIVQIWRSPPEIKDHIDRDLHEFPGFSKVVSPSDDPTAALAQILGNDNRAKVVNDAHRGKVAITFLDQTQRRMFTAGNDGSLRIWSIPETHLLLTLHLPGLLGFAAGLSDDESELGLSAGTPGDDWNLTRIESAFPPARFSDIGKSREAFESWRNQLFLQVHKLPKPTLRQNRNED